MEIAVTSGVHLKTYANLGWLGMTWDGPGGEAGGLRETADKSKGTKTAARRGKTDGLLAPQPGEPVPSSPPTIEGGGDRAFPQVFNYLSTLESWLMGDRAEVMLR